MEELRVEQALKHPALVFGDPLHRQDPALTRPGLLAPGSVSDDLLSAARSTGSGHVRTLGAP
jgi:hypothetical protein